MGRKGGHGNEGANLWYRPMAVLILLVSIVYSAHSAEQFKPQRASQNHCKKKACLLWKLAISMLHFDLFFVNLNCVFYMRWIAKHMSHCKLHVVVANKKAVLGVPIQKKYRA